MNKIVYILLAVLVVLLFAATMLVGSVAIPWADVVRILCGRQDESQTWRFIVLESRLPQAIVATLSGAGLATAGLIMQTVFRNPLAGPDVFGINGGAGVGVAVVMLLTGGSISIATVGLSGGMALVMAALVGAMAVMGLILFCSTLVRSGVMLLVVGIMVGYLTSSVISLLNYQATEQGVRQYMVWGMGDLGGVPPSLLPLFVLLVVCGLLLSLLMVKPLNLLLLGERYAQNMGVSLRPTRTLLLLLAGGLTAVVTAFCGPISFIGLAVPHVARLVTGTDNQRRLLPATMLSGAAITLLCGLLCYLPGSAGLLPLNAVTPLIGAPVILYVILRRR